VFFILNSIERKEVIEYYLPVPSSFPYGALWKIETCFNEFKRGISNAEIQNRNAYAIMNHLHLCMMATSLTWIYASQLYKTPNRRHSVKDRKHFAFSDVRRLVAEVVLTDNFTILFPPLLSCSLPHTPPLMDRLVDQYLVHELRNRLSGDAATPHVDTRSAADYWLPR